MFIMCPTHKFLSREKFDSISASHGTDAAITYQIYMNLREERRQAKAALKTAEGVVKRVMAEYVQDLNHRIEDMQIKLQAAGVDL